ncbi:ABC transporter permease [Streptomyces chumphonensis]|uniref:ABC transporter permease n=1 Tax=Streptomyces chumphonensis TaxID=1214925 RepID=UPI003D71DCF4
MTTATATRSPAPAPLVDVGAPTPRDHLRHVGALVRRQALQAKGDPQSMMDALLMPIVFTLLFVYVFGGAIGAGGDRDRYTDYLMPGMMAMTSIGIAMAVGTGLNEDLRTGVMDRFRALPIARSSVLVAKVVVELGRMLVAFAVLLLVGLAVGLDVDGRWAELGAAVALTALFGTSLLWIFMLLGLLLKSAQAIQGASFLALMPLQFGSSIFVPVETMPGWLEAFASVNPLSHAADAARGLMIGQGPVAQPVLWTLVWAVGLTAVTAPLAVRAFRRRT